MLTSAVLLLSVFAAPRYNSIDLHIDVSERGVFLNDRGTVAGNLHGTEEPFVWRNGVRTRPDGVTRIAGLNARDQVAVETTKGLGIWESRKQTRIWPEPKVAGGSALATRVLGIDDGGNIVLVRTEAGSEGGISRIVTWPKPSRIEERYQPVAMSPDGSILAVIGGTGRSEQKRAAVVLYDENSLRTIGDESTWVKPMAAAKGGWVCGALSDDAGGRAKPFVWHNGRFVMPFWGGEGKAVAVNERGEAVGEAEGEQVVWIGGGAVELRASFGGSERYRLVKALAINGKSQILVQAELLDRPFPRTMLLLTPVKAAAKK